VELVGRTAQRSGASLTIGVLSRTSGANALLRVRSAKPDRGGGVRSGGTSMGGGTDGRSIGGGRGGTAYRGEGTKGRRGVSKRKGEGGTTQQHNP